MTHLEAYQKQFTKLHANKNTRHWTEATTYRAPHKPLLLLSIIDLFSQGRIQTNLIELTADLLDLFGIY